VTGSVADAVNPSAETLPGLLVTRLPISGAGAGTGAGAGAGAGAAHGTWLDFLIAAAERQAV